MFLQSNSVLNLSVNLTCGVSFSVAHPLYTDTDLDLINFLKRVAELISSRGVQNILVNITLQPPSVTKNGYIRFIIKQPIF